MYTYIPIVDSVLGLPFTLLFFIAFVGIKKERERERTMTDRVVVRIRGEPLTVNDHGRNYKRCNYWMMHRHV